MVLRNTVIRQIRKREGFNVKIKRDGRGVHPNTTLPGYPFERALRGVKSVAQWKEDRFFKCYPGYDLDVLNAQGKVAQGKTKLSTVRDTYLED